MNYNFVQILNFLEENAGQIYNPDDEYVSAEMKLVSKTAEMLATLISNRINGFENSKPSKLTKKPAKGQKRVHISD